MSKSPVGKCIITHFQRTCILLSHTCIQNRCLVPTIGYVCYKKVAETEKKKKRKHHIRWWVGACPYHFIFLVIAPKLEQFFQKKCISL